MISIKQFNQVIATNNAKKEQILIKTLPSLEKEIDNILSTGQHIIPIDSLRPYEILIKSNLSWYIRELNRIYSVGGWLVIEGYKTLDFISKEEESVTVT